MDVGVKPVALSPQGLANCGGFPAVEPASGGSDPLNKAGFIKANQEVVRPRGEQDEPIVVPAQHPHRSSSLLSFVNLEEGEPITQASAKDKKDPHAVLKQLQEEFQKASEALQNKTSKHLRGNESFGSSGGVSLLNMERREALRQLRAEKKPIEVNPPPKISEDGTCDKTEEELLTLNLIADSIGATSDLVTMISDAPAGFLAQSSDGISSLIGMMPEFLTMVAKVKQWGHGNKIQRHYQEITEKISDLKNDLGLEVTTDEESKKVIEKALAELDAIQKGVDAAKKYGEMLADVKTEIGLSTTAVVAGVVDTSGAVLTALGSHIAGGSLGAFGGVFSLPFQAYFLKESYEKIAEFKKNQESSKEVLNSPEGQKKTSSVNRTSASSLSRGLAKMAKLQSSVGEARFKTFIFALGILTTLCGIATSIAIAVAAAPVIAVVGIAASGLGFFSVALLGSYEIYKKIKEAYNETDLQKAFQGNDCKQLRVLSERQIVKCENRIAGELLKDFLSKELGEKRDYTSIRNSLYEFMSPECFKLDPKPRPPKIALDLAAKIDSKTHLNPNLSIASIKEIIDQFIEERNKKSERILQRGVLHEKIQRALNTKILDTVKEPGNREYMMNGKMMELLSKYLPIENIPKDQCAFFNKLQKLSVVASDKQEIARHAQLFSVSDITDLFTAVGKDLGRLSAGRKLLRMDREFLLTRMIEDIAALEDKKDKNEESQLGDAAAALKMRKDLERFGISEKSIEDAIQAHQSQGLNETLHAVARMGRELKF